LVSTHRAAQGGGQTLAFAHQAAACETCQLRRIGRPICECLEHSTARHASDVGDDRTELHVGCFQELLDALHDLSTLPHDGNSIAHQLAQLASGTIRDSAAA